MADVSEQVLICAADDVVEGGRGVRFRLTAGGDSRRKTWQESNLI